MNGLLILDKPAGMTSHDVVARTRRIVNERSIGHLGTLDPMATGVLPLLLGRYTRLAQFFGRHGKSYTGTIRFWPGNNHLRCRGRAGWPSSRCRSMGELRRRRSFNGELLQTPPAYSAKKIRGRSAYSLARAGEPVELAPVRIVVHDLRLHRWMAILPSFALRSLPADISARWRMIWASGWAAARIWHRCDALPAGRSALTRRISLEQLAALSASRGLGGHLPHPRTLLPELPATTVDAHTAGRMRNGAMCNLADFSAAPRVKVSANRHELIGIAQRVAGTLFQPIVVLADAQCLCSKGMINGSRLRATC